MKWIRKFIAPAALILLAATSLSCGGDDENPVNPGGGGTADVTIHILAGRSQAGANAYSPNPANVTVGQTVRWVNDDNMGHTATGSSFNTGTIAGNGGQSALITINNAGTLGYVCSVQNHNMSGTLNVTTP